MTRWVGQFFTDQYLRNLFGLTLQQFGPVVGQLRDRWLRRIPVAGVVLIKIGRRLCEVTQCVPKYCRSFAGLHATQLNPAVLFTPVRRSGSRNRTQEQRSRHAETSLITP